MNNELTKKEIDILDLVSRGLPFKQIGNIQTIKNHLHIIRRKLKADNTIHAVAIAIRNGII